jgi:hypothetical protein
MEIAASIAKLTELLRHVGRAGTSNLKLEYSRFFKFEIQVHRRKSFASSRLART